MPKAKGRVCTRCTKRLTDPCDGENTKCPYYNNRPRNLRYLWIPVLFMFGLLLFGCEPDHYEQIKPTTCTDRDTGYVIVFNRWARLPDDTIAVERHRGIFNEVSCQGEKRERILLPITAPILRYWVDPTAYTKFEHCN